MEISGLYISGYIWLRFSAYICKTDQEQQNYASENCIKRRRYIHRNFHKLGGLENIKKNYHIEAEEGELSDAHLKEFGLRIKDYIQNPDARKDLDEVRKKYTSWGWRS